MAKDLALLELKTYRYGGHSRSDTGPLSQSRESWSIGKGVDPIDILVARMLADGELDEAEYAENQGCDSAGSF